MNFFLFNQIIDGIDYIVFDELVFQALTANHTVRFDCLAMFAFLFSHAGVWRSARRGQRYPAPWATQYVLERVVRDFKWNTVNINADDIEKFVASAPEYTGETARKLSTNLSFLFKHGNLADFATKKVSRWWVDAVFLALDRSIEDRRIDNIAVSESNYLRYLDQDNFRAVSGQSSVEKDLAVRHVIALYAACGGLDRFSKDAVMERHAIRLGDLYQANDPGPIGALHPTNPRIIKSIPRVCAMLAKHVGFETIEMDDLDSFSSEEFVKKQTESALKKLQAEGVKPNMTADELMRITRDK